MANHLTLLGTVLSTLVATAAAQNDAPPTWSQFRGPAGRGIAADGPKLPTEFSSDKNMLWKCPIKPGHSSPCIWGDRIFLTTVDDKTFETLCVDRITGEVQWSKKLEVKALERSNRVNSHAAPTPTTDGERVFAYFGSVGLLCYDMEGKEVWRREFPQVRNLFGTAASPIIVGDALILNRDNQEGSFLESIVKATGKTTWRVDRDSFKSSWSTPTVWSHDGIDELLIYGVFQLTAYDLHTGEERWSVPGLADEPAITPVTGEGLVFVTSYNMNTNPEVLGLPKFEKLLADYDKDKNGTLNLEEAMENKSVLSRTDADGEGDHPLKMFFRGLDKNRDGELNKTEWQKLFGWLGNFKHKNALVAIRPGDGKEKSAEIAWQHPRGVPECPSPLYYKGRIYLVKNGGLATCLDARTGELKYQKRLGTRGPCYASPIVGDGKIYTASARGVVTVFAVGDKLEVLARNDLGERIMATPAIVDGKLYVRTDEHLYAFGL